MAKKKSDNDIVSAISTALKERNDYRDALAVIATGSHEGTAQEYAKAKLKKPKKN